MKQPLRVALAGNPNAGKSSLFNALTGANQHVGNWPGKTVEKKTGACRHKGRHLEIVDLPGAYSLSAFSPEELITREYILQAEPDVVVIVLDAANLERNLYLAVQLLELETTAVLVLNMMDVAAARGITIDADRLSDKVNAPVVCTVARRGEGIPTLLDTIIQSTEETPHAHA